MVRVGTVVRTLTLCGLALTTLAFAKTNKDKTIVTLPYGFAVSQPVSDLPIDYSVFASHVTPEPRPLPLRDRAVPGPVGQEDSVLQKEVLPQVAATPGIRFDGISSPGYAPSDANMAIGPNHIVETVNVQFAVYNKSGATLAGPTNLLNVFAPLGGVCTNTYGDPVVLYDRPADRWVLSIIGNTGSTQAECVAVSKTNNPAGAYYLYGYSFGADLNDYPKLSTWATATNSAYLASYNIFINFQSFGGSDLCAFDRTKMLAGDPSAAQLCQMTPNNEGGYLPSDLDGPTVPTDGTPGLFITWQNNNPGQLYLRKLSLNFAAGTSTLSSPTTISVANDTLSCNGTGGTCVPQSGTSQTLDTLGDRMMYRFALRHFPDHDRAVFSHAVTNSSQVGIRWYEIFDPAGAVTLNQQGTFAPDSTYRWMSSMAEDKNGDIGLGYSASSSSLHPAVRFTGRVPSDPLGTLESETSIIEPAGSQTTGLSRWGDYTAMQVDPSDDCTFWYVDQYEQTSGTFNWHTSISSFQFDACSGNPVFSLSASPNSVNLIEGGTGTSTITVNPVNGFNGSVALSATGLPSGVTATFNPTSTTSTSTLTLTASATAAAGTSTVTITGVSGSLTETTTLSLTVVGNGPTVTVSPTSLAWGSVVVTATGAAKAVTLTNTGTSTLTIGSIAASGDFALATSTKPCGSTLAAGKYCIIKVTFAPTKVGTRTGTLTISDNSPTSPHTVALSGTGTAQATLTPASASWDFQTVGTVGPTKVFTLANKQAVALTGIVISTSADYIVTSTTCTTSLVAKSKCKINVAFKPTKLGLRNGTLSVADSAVDSPQTANLTGYGR